MSATPLRPISSLMTTTMQSQRPRGQFFRVSRTVEPAPGFPLLLTQEPKGVSKELLRKIVLEPRLKKRLTELFPRDIDAIAYVWGHDGIAVWTVVDQANHDLQRQVFDAEAATMDAFPVLDFRFRMVFRGDRDARDLLPDGALLLEA